jgi:hypothetical protein
VMIKVSGGGRSSKAVAAHIDYIDRHGKLEIEMDDGERMEGRAVGKALSEDWDLDLEEMRGLGPLARPSARPPPKLVHNLVFSMPAKTSPEKLLASVRDFAREEFALKHRYAMVLHTDQDHPHVHVVVKAMNEQGMRLNIRKATLRRWRAEFARQLREHGVPANATDRAVRGRTGLRKKDAIYRAMKRGASDHVHSLVSSIVGELRSGHLRAEAGKDKLLATRKEVEKGWQTVSTILASEGHLDLAEKARAFADALPPLRTEREWIAEQLLQDHERRRRGQVLSR